MPSKLCVAVILAISLFFCGRCSAQDHVLSFDVEKGVNGIPWGADPANIAGLESAGPEHPGFFVKKHETAKLGNGVEFSQLWYSFRDKHLIEVLLYVEPAQPGDFDRLRDEIARKYGAGRGRQGETLSWFIGKRDVTAAEEAAFAKLPDELKGMDRAQFAITLNAYPARNSILVSVKDVALMLDRTLGCTN